MKRWLTHGFIAAYLTALVGGVAAHAIQFGITIHPAMYFVVWDMFCGWSAFDARTHIIGQGADGKFYELAPGPWGEFHPFGNLDRRHYDMLFNASQRIAANTLRHTRHEPIARYYVIEECWPKKFNVPDEIWDRRSSEPKDIHKYYHVKSVYSGDGTLLVWNPTWLSQQYGLAVANNPRLQTESRRGREFLMVTPHSRLKGAFDSPMFADGAPRGESGAWPGGSAN